MPSVTLGDTVFNTKKDLSQYIRSLLWSTSIGATILEPAATDLLNLLKLHPEFEMKQGCGIAHFTVKDTLHAARAFEIVRTDKTREVFSYLRCLNPPPSMQRRLVDAFRIEVEDDIFNLRKAYFTKHGDTDGRVPCAITGELISIDQSHADHAPPRTFNELVGAFIVARSRDFEHRSALFTPADGYRERYADRQLADDFRQYHHRRAYIRIVSKTANMHNSHAGRPNPKDRQLDFSGLLDNDDDV